jgi:magnesium-transporting ATPase (P-type)
MMQDLTSKKKILSHDWGALFLLPLFWAFILMLLFQFFYPLLSSTIGIGTYYGIIGVMFIFAIIAPFIHMFFYQVNFLKMVCLWLLCTAIGFLRLENGIHFSQTMGVFHFLSWQLPAMVFSLIYSFLYAKKQDVKLNLMDPSVF